MRRIGLKTSFLPLSIILATAGCASAPIVPQESNGSIDKTLARSEQLGGTAEQLVAINLVDALAQIEGSKPGQIVLNMDSPKREFDQYVFEILTNSGYTVKRDSTESGAIDLRIEISAKQSDGSLAPGEEAKTYQLEVGTVKIKRDFAFNYGLAIPRSPLFLLGADTSGINFSQAQALKTGATQTAITTQATDSAANGNDIEESTGPNQSESKSASLVIKTLRDVKKGIYKEGEEIVVFAAASKDSKLYCFYQDGMGNIAKIYPNRFVPDNTITAGQVLKIPGTDKWRLDATKAGVAEHFLCIAADMVTDTKLRELDIIPDLQTLLVEDLTQIYDRFVSAAGQELVSHSIDVEVQ